MNDIKFSCVVPVYNAHKYLHECINSLLSQSYINIEIILINDGSTDDSALICDSFAARDYRIKVIHKLKEGAGEARNVGIKNATGDYIIFLEPDDFLKLEALERISNIIKFHKDVDIIASNGIILRNDDENVVKFSTILDNKPLSGGEFLKYQLKNTTFLSETCHHIVKRSLLIVNDIFFNKDFIIGEDKHWTPRVYLKANSVITSNFAHYYCRVGHVSYVRPDDKSVVALPMLCVCFEMAEVYKEIGDKELRLLLMDDLVNLYLSACYEGNYRPKRGFLKFKVYFFKTSIKIILFNINPVLYFWIYKNTRKIKIKIHKLKIKIKK